MKQINNLKIKLKNHKFQVIAPKGVVLEEFDFLEDAEDWASQTTDFIQLRKKFPVKGVFSSYGLCDSNYVNEEDRKIYKYVMPAEGAESHFYAGDCWIVDKHGNIYPHMCNPTPIHRNLIGRKVK